MIRSISSGVVVGSGCCERAALLKINGAVKASREIITPRKISLIRKCNIQFAKGDGVSNVYFIDVIVVGVVVGDVTLPKTIYLTGRRYFATANSPIRLPMAVPTSVELR